MQPTSARYIAKSIQDDRLATAARDRRLLGVAAESQDAAHAGIRLAISSRFASVAAHFAVGAR